LRKAAVDYLSLAAACWKCDAFERQLPAVKQTLRAAVADADPGETLCSHPI